MNDAKGSNRKRCRRRGSFWMAVLIAATVISGHLSGCGLQRWGWERWTRGHTELSREELRQRLDRWAGWVLGRVDATEDQRRQVDAILDDLAPELFALRNERLALREQLFQVLEEEEVSRQRLNRVESASLTLAERALTGGMGALRQVAVVFTAEQRRELVAAWRKR